MGENICEYELHSTIFNIPTTSSKQLHISQLFVWFQIPSWSLKLKFYLQGNWVTFTIKMIWELCINLCSCQQSTLLKSQHCKRVWGMFMWQIRNNEGWRKEEQKGHVWKMQADIESKGERADVAFGWKCWIIMSLLITVSHHGPAVMHRETVMIKSRERQRRKEKPSSILPAVPTSPWKALEDSAWSLLHKVDMQKHSISFRVSAEHGSPSTEPWCL